MTREEIILKVLTLLQEAAFLLAELEESNETRTLAGEANSFLGQDASPKDIVDDEVGCAESVTNILQRKLPDFPIITGTWTLWDRLRSDKRFKEVHSPRAGDIIISPTGTLANAPFPGHVGIMSSEKVIMSNNSSNGKWETNYTVDTWRKRWANAGYPVYYFRLA